MQKKVVMKKILTFLVAILVLSISSCNKEERSLQHIGTWKIIQLDTLVGTTRYQVKLDSCSSKELLVFTERTFTSYSYEKQKSSECSESITEIPYSYEAKTLKFFIGSKLHTFEMSILQDDGTLVMESPLPNNKKLFKRYERLK